MKTNRNRKDQLNLQSIDSTMDRLIISKAVYFRQSNVKSCHQKPFKKKKKKEISYIALQGMEKGPVPLKVTSIGKGTYKKGGPGKLGGLIQQFASS